MTDKKEKESKDLKYNKKRRPLFRVEVSTADSAEDIVKMEQMKADLIAKSDNAKQGVIDMYDFARKHGYFDE
tara:strand:- start:1494 stop:1709 length:216 start_codon:yes stop_codon:yes gene_type:complete